MSLTWLTGFICKDLYAPFVLEKDSEYVTDLKKKYKTVIKQAKMQMRMLKALKFSTNLKTRF